MADSPLSLIIFNEQKFCFICQNNNQAMTVQTYMSAKRKRVGKRMEEGGETKAGGWEE